MKTSVLDLTIDDQPVKITVKRASIEDGITRYLLASKGEKENETEQVESCKLMRLILFPNLMAATVSIDGLPFPMTFDEFREVDEDAVNKWADVVYELNPHWLASSNQDESKKKSSRKR